MSQPRIHILWNFVHGPYGGGNQFLRSLKAELTARGAYADDPKEANGILFNSFPTDHSLFKRALDIKVRNPSTVLVHRLDGPLSTIRGTDNQSADLAIHEFANLIADGCIFQSQWSLKENIKLGFDASCIPSVVALNAPAPTLFNTKNKAPFRSEKPRIIASSWSSNMRKGFGDYLWIDQNLDFNRYSMTFVGRSPHKFQNINTIAPMDQGELATLLKQHDIYISGSRFEACSNAILEAIHCGLPALCYNGSSNSETLQACGLLYERPEEIPSTLETICRDFLAHQRQIAPMPLSTVADQYLEFFGALLKLRTAPKRPSRPAFREFLARYVPAQTGLTPMKHKVKAGLSGLLSRFQKGPAC